MPESRINVEEPIVACDYERTWVYANGHVPKSKVRGAFIEAYHHEDALNALFAAKGVHGFRVTRLVSTSDGEWCDGATELYTFQRTEPEPSGDIVRVEPVTYFEVDGGFNFDA